MVGIEQSHDRVIWLMIALALDLELDFSQFSCLVNGLVACLENQRLADMCISQPRLLRGILQVLERSYSIEVDSDDVEILAQLRLKINRSLAEISGSSGFIEHYTLDSPLSHTLMSWLRNNNQGKEQLQICSCLILGNLARTNEVCQRMVTEYNIHRDLIAILNTPDASDAVLHAALGFLKNLAVPAHSKAPLADAGIIPSASRLWASVMPQVQFSAATLVRQVTTSSMQNISRLLAAADDGDDTSSTYLSRLLCLFEKTDSDPIKIDIGRTIVSILRTLIPKTRAGDQEAVSLYHRLVDLHRHVALPIGAMLVQTQWPVVRSEGWFALALMASTTLGSTAVVDCLVDVPDASKLLADVLEADIPQGVEQGDRSWIMKDRDNAIILIKGLLENAVRKSKHLLFEISILS